jgi:hypothetical protein
VIEGLAQRQQHDLMPFGEDQIGEPEAKEHIGRQQEKEAEGGEREAKPEIQHLVERRDGEAAVDAAEQIAQLELRYVGVDVVPEIDAVDKHGKGRAQVEQAVAVERSVRFGAQQLGRDLRQWEAESFVIGPLAAQ